MSVLEEQLVPRQLVLGGFSASLQTTRATDDAVLRAAIGRLFEIAEFVELTRATKEVTIALLARRDFKTPTQIHPSAYNQEFIARATGVSRSTVKRAYATLDGLGWLIRGEQAYDERHKRYEGASLEFSASFAEVLGLGRTFDAAVKEIAPRAPESTFTAAQENRFSPVVQNEPLIKEDSLEQSIQRQSHGQAGEQKPVPRELFCLIEKGLSCWTVFWLMKLAGQAGKRLSDVVEVKRAAIEKRRGRMLVGLLQTLIRDNVDYSWRKKELHEVAQEQTEIHRSERELEELAGRVVCVDGGGQAIRVHQRPSGFHGELIGAQGSIPHGELLKLARAGRLKPWTSVKESNSTDKTDITNTRKPEKNEATQDALLRIRSLVGIRGAK